MEFVNLLYKRGSTDFAVDTLLKLLAPAAPHITAELWERRHPGEHVHELPWPVADPALAAVDSVTMVVQVNGKVKARVEVDPGIAEAEAEAWPWRTSTSSPPWPAATPEAGHRPAAQDRQHRRLT